MALINLPDYPFPKRVIWRKRDFGATLRGGLGAADQRLNRLGNRWIVTVVMPSMEIQQAREWSTKLSAAVEAGGVRWWVRQLGLAPGVSGTPVVDGSSQSGHSLAIKGLRAGYSGQIGQYLALVVSGQRYGYRLTAPFKADALGNAVAPIDPALRVEPGDEDTIEISKPYIEGLLANLPEEATDVSYLVEGFQFTIEESR